MKIDHPKRQLWIILAITFFGFLGLSVPYLIFPSLFLDPALSIIPIEWGDKAKNIFLGIALAAYPFGQFFGSPVLGALSDEYGHRKVMSSSLIIAACFTFLTGFSIQFKMVWLLILSRFAAGLMEGNLAIARSMASEIKEFKKHETFGKINAVISIAYILGPLIGGVLTDGGIYPLFALSTPFFLTGLIFIALSFLSYYMIAENTVSSIQHKTVMERINFVSRLKVLFNNKNLKFLLILVTVFTLAVDIFFEFGPVYLTIKWMILPSELAIYNAALCVGLAFGSGFLVAMLSSYYSNRIVVVTTLAGFFAILMSIVFADNNLLMLLLFLLIGFVIGIASTNLTVQVSDSASEKIQGEVMGVQMSLRVLGDACICVFGGILTLISTKLILVVSAFISLFVLVIYRNRFK